MKFRLFRWRSIIYWYLSSHMTTCFCKHTVQGTACHWFFCNCTRGSVMEDRLVFTVLRNNKVVHGHPCFVFLTDSLSTCMSFYLSVPLSTHLSVCPSICSFVHPSVFPFLFEIHCFFVVAVLVVGGGGGVILESVCSSVHVSDCVHSVSPEPLNHFLPNLVWRCIIMR